MAKQFKLNTALSLEYPDNIIPIGSCIKRGETFEYSLSDFDFDKLTQLSISVGQNGIVNRYDLYNAEGALDNVHFYQKGDEWYFYLKASETSSFIASEGYEEMVTLEIAETSNNEYGKEQVNIFDPIAFWIFDSLYSSKASAGGGTVTQNAIVSEVLYCSDNLVCQE